MLSISVNILVSKMKNKLKSYNDTSIKTIIYILLGLRETAKIINLNSFRFWKNTSKGDIQHYRKILTICRKEYDQN